MALCVCFLFVSVVLVSCEQLLFLIKALLVGGIWFGVLSYQMTVYNESASDDANDFKWKMKANP